MSLSRLEIHGVRNLQAVSLQLHPHLNVFAGANGSGKSSLLEALHLLGLGRSFRSGRARRLVHDQLSQCTVFAEFADGRQLGLQRGANGDTLLRRDGRPAQSLAEMAQCLPLLLLDPESMDLLDAGSKPRRAQLDWGVFHVEQGFYPVWLRYQRALKQRNSLLRSGSMGRREAAPWDAEMADSAGLLHQFRQDYLQCWQPHWQACVERFLPGLDLQLDYQPGWAVEQDLRVVLAAQWDRDRERGHSQLGPHRADLRVRQGMAAADEVLSRGQKKLLVCALKLSQLAVLPRQAKQVVMLVDDLAAELDGGARQRLLAYLLASGAQVFITTIEAEALLPALVASGGTYKMFHVEQGSIREAGP